ncbi:MAG: histidine kinase [Candidatus Cloacimonetes bacterium HGW-Cloacimonetes-3]|jgi:iron only hydrogenase large subunit-like protein/uncharacterized Fe-S cluster-containing protein|nr:MAG: histidine kinase [Candidatus Cloacimonetes bacterium HGW-Cloacimonetes-3]
MNRLKPIYTEKTECQDCYKCVRACPVKAIRVANGSAEVIPEACILCGHCTQVCPVGAKKTRDDLHLAKELLKSKQSVYASIAPSYITEFGGLQSGKLIAALKQLGFAGVSETALGAQVVSAACAQLMSCNTQNILISSACPSVVHLIEQYYPHLTGSITPLMSPLRAHATMLKKEYGEDIGIVFFGPCIAKKTETGDDFDVALTFGDLRRWFTLEGVDWINIDSTEAFVPESAEEGGLYPIDGGMCNGIKACQPASDIHYMCFSGIDEIMEALRDIDKTSYSKPIFIEALACPGGCINGPAVSSKGATAKKRYKVLTDTPPSQNSHYDDSLSIGSDYAARAIYKKVHSSTEIGAALLRISKKRREDELNCGGCGYDTCRDFAAALLEDKAEPAMCVSYLRKLTQNKAAALIKAMPSGVVIVDDSLKIIESNARFIEIIGGDASIVSEADPDLEGAYLERLISFHDLFATVLKNGSEVLVRDIHHQGKILRITIFSIQPHQVVGGILQDITEPVIQREQIIQKAGEVMKKNLTTVQQIAFLLGENAADSEVLLNSIIQSFSGKE